MLRLTHRLAEHVQSAAAHNSPVFHATKSRHFWARRWHNFCRRGLIGRALTLVGYSSAGLGAYLASCLVVRTMHQPVVDSLFTSSEHYTLEEWRTVEPTLQPGDIILMRGSGLMSWTITSLQFVYSFMRPAALRYSHVAVVVAPAVVEYVDEATYAQSPLQPPPYQVDRLEDVFANDAAPQQQQQQRALSTAAVAAAVPSSSSVSVHAQLQAEETALRRRPVVRRGAIILEAMDNKDYDLPDVTGKVLYDCVQVVEAGRRIFSTTSKKEPAYQYFSVRRLQNYEHTPERKARMLQFCQTSIGRKMDSSLLYPLAFMDARLHTLTHPLRSAVTGEISCSELIVELYQCLGIIQRHWRWVPLRRSSNSTAAPVVAATDDTITTLQTSVAPSPADQAHDRSAASLHVYDYVYGRVNDRTTEPVVSRERPVLDDASTIENGQVLSSKELQRRSREAPLQLAWPEVDAQRSFTDFHGRQLQGEDVVAARQQLKTRPTATLVRHPEVPVPVLRAGDVAEGVDGKPYQLQWFYRHNSVATCPYHFTMGAGETVLDFGENMGLGPEIYMHIDRPEDPSTWVLGEE